MIENVFADHVAITYTEPALYEKALYASQVTGYPLAQSFTCKNKAQFFLLFSSQGISLQLHGSHYTPVYIDFLSKKIQYRLKYGGGMQQQIFRAVGIKPGIRPAIIDATAGLGTDSFLFASYGCQVTLIERSPVLVLLLQDAFDRVHRASHGVFPAALAAIKCMHLVSDDARNYLHNLSSKPEIVYLDPMFPPTGKTALAKKEMRILARLVGTDEDSDSLLETALQVASRRVVVKRPLISPHLANLPPQLCLTGKANRFDIYLC